MKPYPLKFNPLYKQRIWGGRRLRDFFGKEFPKDIKIGESWELADLPEDKSVIENGYFAGRTLNWVLRQFSEEITGNVNYNPPFPLLIKLLDAQDILSVQVHPDAETCSRMGKGDPKTECWYIIDAAKDAVIYKGLKAGVTRERFARAIEQGNVEEMLVEVKVKAGECHFLPAGTPHSIGAGLLIAEVQTPSDTTYRVFDWNRVDQSGKTRQLHIEEALESIHFDASRDNLSVKTIGRLVDCPYFKIDKGHQAGNCELLLVSGYLKIMMILAGGGKIADEDGDSVNFHSGDTLLIPASFEGAAIFGNETEYLTITL